VKKSPNRADMIFMDERRDQYWAYTENFLRDLFGGLVVLDVACGFGRFAKCFNPELYHGVDFSAEMLDIAGTENPDCSFFHEDAKNFVPPVEMNVIFEVNSLRSLGMTQQEFVDHYKQYANMFVACIEADQFCITPIYETR